MWEDPTALWGRLKLGREEYLQRLVTTLICDGVAPRWNSPRTPCALGQDFLALLDELAHGPQGPDLESAGSVVFVDEYKLPKLEETADNGWPDWAVVWSDRVWVIELKTEAGSHRADQLPYYLRLAAAAHPGCDLDLTYITGPLTKPAPALLEGQRYSHLMWDQVLPLIEQVWGRDERSEVAAYVDMVRTVVTNLTRLRPTEQRERVLGIQPDAVAAEEHVSPESVDADLLDLARATAADGQQRGVGAPSPEALEALRDQARAAISRVPSDDSARFVLPWLWDSRSAGGKALTPEGDEFGYELRFSRYKSIQITE